MGQLNLFETPRRPREPAPADLAFVRRHLNYALRLVRNAERLPWPAPEAQDWAERFPELARRLPPAEGEPMIATFFEEMDRLKTA